MTSGLWILIGIGFLFIISLTCFIMDIIKSDEKIIIQQYQHKQYEKIEPMSDDELIINDYDITEL
jgi:hypothetical protein